MWRWFRSCCGGCRCRVGALMGRDASFRHIFFICLDIHSSHGCHFTLRSVVTFNQVHLKILDNGRLLREHQNSQGQGIHGGYPQDGWRWWLNIRKWTGWLQDRWRAAAAAHGFRRLKSVASGNILGRNDYQGGIRFSCPNQNDALAHQVVERSNRCHFRGAVFGQVQDCRFIRL